MQQSALQSQRTGRRLNRLSTWFSKPYNVILLVLGILLSFSTIAPIISILVDTVTVHPGSVDSIQTGLMSGYTFYNWKDLFTGALRIKNFWTPLKNTVLMSVFSCIGAIVYGGSLAYLVTRTNLKFKNYLMLKLLKKNPNGKQRF